MDERLVLRSKDRSLVVKSLCEHYLQHDSLLCLLQALLAVASSPRKAPTDLLDWATGQHSI